uniref:Putative mitochondrial import inner membrane translocase subunit tim23 n=1 Tax=Ixodes ricinus TaxID=34613 RepID=V5IG13_IXORI
MDRQGGSYFGAYPSIDPSFQIPSGQNAPVSPYLNFDPAYINAGGPEWIFPKAHRGNVGVLNWLFLRLEAPSWLALLLAECRDSTEVSRRRAWPDTRVAFGEHRCSTTLRRGGAGSANVLGVVAVMYSGFGVLFSFVRGADDELNTLAGPGPSTGLLYKSSSGLRRCRPGRRR